MISKKTMWKIITVTMVALAASIIITAIGGGFILAKNLFNFDIFNLDWFPNDVEQDGAEDNKAPTLTADSDTVIIYTGSTLSYRKFVKITDNSDGELKLDATKSTVKQDIPGEYSVTLVATDAAGNKSKPLTLKVIVKDKMYSEASLMQAVEKMAQEKLGYTKATATKSKADIVRDIYNFVRDPAAGAQSANIVFDNSRSNAPSQLSQNGQKNRKNWKIDWVEEAVITLDLIEKGRGVGDCYTYYSVSKAFFEYFGIENVGIQRAEKSSQGGTHYWHAVKVEGGWYYYDSTRSGSQFHSGGVVDNNSCLITEERLLSYVINRPDAGTNPNDYYVLDKVNPDFFDADDNGGKFPTIATKKLGQ